MSRAMKDSGIPWIGEIPSHWKTNRLKSFGYLYGGLTGKAGDDFNVDEENDRYALFIPFTNIWNNSFIDIDNLYKVKVEEGEKQNEVAKGDILFLMSSEDYDGVGKPALMNESVSPLYLNSFCKGLRITSNKIYPLFLFYLLSCEPVRNIVMSMANGFIRINLRAEKLGTCPIIYPDWNEQQTIADYLDKKCSEIDEMISLQEKIVEELKAYKQSVITEAVCKGLNTDVPMKDSGIEWIGQIPEGWRIMRIKNLSQFYNGYAFDSNAFRMDNPIPVIRIGDISANLDYDLCVKVDYSTELTAFVIQDGDVLIAMSGATTGKCCLVSKPQMAYINQRVGIIRGSWNRFVFYALQAAPFYEYVSLNSAGSAQPNISATGIGNHFIAVPDKATALYIADYLDTKCSEIDTLISVKQSKIEALKEYKKSIIYEYITGKKEVEA